MERELYAKRRRHWEPDVQSRMETKRTNPEYGRSGTTATISKLYIDEMKNLYLEVILNHNETDLLADIPRTRARDSAREEA